MTLPDYMPAHYSESCLHMKQAQKVRDRFFFGMLIVLSVFVSPLTSNELTKELATLIASAFKLKMSEIFFEYFDILSWFALCFFSIKYCQSHAYLRRCYAYIHKLEEEIQEHLHNDVFFTREGTSYANSSKRVTQFISLLYRRFFPFVVIAASFKRLHSDISLENASSTGGISILICFFISVIIFAALLFDSIHKDNASWKSTALNTIIQIVIPIILIICATLPG